MVKGILMTSLKLELATEKTAVDSKGVNLSAAEENVDAKRVLVLRKKDWVWWSVGRGSLGGRDCGWSRRKEGRDGMPFKEERKAGERRVLIREASEG
jgi:hypothetical protein